MRGVAIAWLGCVCSLLAVGVACKGDHAAPSGDPPRPATVVEAAPDAAPDRWHTCEDALRKAPQVSANRRAQAILDGCQVCGDWTPLLAWNTPPGSGGPTRMAIETAMAACGYCDPTAKQRFLGALDEARGTASRAPWRLLGDVCKAAVSAVPDGRFLSAPYYALDRIARAAAARPETAALLAAIEIALPPVSINGVGLELASSPVTAPSAGPLQITVMPSEIRIGGLPRATLTAAGVVVTQDGEPYPGTLVDLKALAAAAKPGAAIAILAPRAMAAKVLLPIIAALPGRKLVLAVAAAGAPTGWTLPGSIPVSLDAKPDPKALVLQLAASADPAIIALKAAPRPDRVTLTIGATATVESLAKLLGAVAYTGVKQASLR